MRHSVMQRRRNRFARVLGVLAIGGLLLALPITSVPKTASAGWIVCAGAKGWCIYKPPWHSPIDQNESDWPGTPAPANCAASQSWSVTADAAHGVGKADVATEVDTAPCVGGAYFSVGFSTDTWTAQGGGLDQLRAFWNVSAEQYIWVDCQAVDTGVIVYSETLFGLNLYDFNTSSWVYPTSSPLETTNTTWGVGWIHATCSSVGANPATGACASNCQFAYTWSGLSTYKSNIYTAFLFMEGIDPTYHLPAGDVAWGCYLMDDNNLGGTLGEPACYGQPTYKATLTSVHIE